MLGSWKKQDLKEDGERKTSSASLEQEKDVPSTEKIFSRSPEIFMSITRRRTRSVGADTSTAILKSANQKCFSCSSYGLVQRQRSARRLEHLR